MTRRVLLVDGDPLTRELFRHLQHGDDYEVETIDYCEDALTVLLRRPFDLVLLLSLNAPWRTWSSLSLPARRIGSKSAILFLKQIRALHSPVPVIVVSGLAQAKEEALAHGALAFVPNPFPNPFDVRELDRLVALANSHERSRRVEGKVKDESCPHCGGQDDPHESR